MAQQAGAKGPRPSEFDARAGGKRVDRALTAIAVERWRRDVRGRFEAFHFETRGPKIYLGVWLWS